MGQSISAATIMYCRVSSREQAKGARTINSRKAAKEAA